MEIIKTDEEAFDICLNGEIVRHFDSERWLRYDLCSRLGYCGEELEPIIRELNLTGRKAFAD
jgi:hypothetical protein